MNDHPNHNNMFRFSDNDNEGIRELYNEAFRKNAENADLEGLESKVLLQLNPKKTKGSFPSIISLSLKKFMIPVTLFAALGVFIFAMLLPGNKTGHDKMAEVGENVQIKHMISTKEGGSVILNKPPTGIHVASETKTSPELLTEKLTKGLLKKGKENGPSAVVSSFSGNVSSVIIMETPETRQTIVWFSENS